MTNQTVGFQQIAQYLSHLSLRYAPGSVYRGHAAKSWQVIPSSFRNGVAGIKTPGDLAKWKEAARRFVDRPQTDLEWLVLAQHYGVPTALLDWTTNPLVALYFACQPAADPFGNTLDGAVVTIDKGALWKELNPGRVDVFNTWSGPPMLVPSETMNKRSMAQDSVMTLHCQGNQELLPDYDPTIWLIPHVIKSSTLAALKVISVSSDRIYADINTAAREYDDDLKQAASTRDIAATMPQ
jgi:hypothetical protein